MNSTTSKSRLSRSLSRQSLKERCVLSTYDTTTVHRDRWSNYLDIYHNWSDSVNVHYQTENGGIRVEWQVEVADEFSGWFPAIVTAYHEKRKPKREFHSPINLPQTARSNSSTSPRIKSGRASQIEVRRNSTRIWGDLQSDDSSDDNVSESQSNDELSGDESSINRIEEDYLDDVDDIDSLYEWESEVSVEVFNCAQSLSRYLSSSSTTNTAAYRGIIPLDSRVVRLVSCRDVYSMPLFNVIVRDSVCRIYWEVDWFDPINTITTTTASTSSNSVVSRGRPSREHIYHSSDEELVSLDGDETVTTATNKGKSTISTWVNVVYTHTLSHSLSLYRSLDTFLC